MNFKSILISMTILVLGAESALACNWYRTGRDGEYLECRSSYKNFMLVDAGRVERIVEAAKYFALGELQKISNESWMIRQALTVDEGEQLLKNRAEAKVIIDEINDQLRKRAAMDEDLNWDDVKDIIPSAYVFGLTVSINQKLPLDKLLSKLPALQPGGSVFVGVVLLPQKIHYKMDPKGNEVELGAIEKITWDYRTVLIPSADAAVGTKGQFKQKGGQVTMGMVFGENIYSTHQLLGQGWSVSVPSQLAGTIPNLPVVGPFANGLLKAAALAKVDTVKIGLSRASLSPDAEQKDDDNIKTYSENLWMWFRWTNGGAVGQALEGTTADLFADLKQGKARASAFWVMAPWSDGESSSFYNGLGGDGASIFSGVLSEVLKEYLGEDELDEIAEETQLTDEQKEALRRELEENGVMKQEENAEVVAQ